MPNFRQTGIDGQCDQRAENTADYTEQDQCGRVKRFGGTQLLARSQLRNNADTDEKEKEKSKGKKKKKAVRKTDTCMHKTIAI